jgi:hypothetical protein
VPEKEADKSEDENEGEKYEEKVTLFKEFKDH